MSVLFEDKYVENGRMPGRHLARTSEELQQLQRMCREGRVYDVEQWIKEGKPVQLDPNSVPRGRRPPTALQIALKSGQHSLTLLLLRSGYRLELEPDSPLDTVLESRRWDLFELLLEWGADLKSAHPYHILKTYSTELYERYFAAGYDLTKGHEMAAILGLGTSNRPLYGFAKRHRIEDPRIQRELNMALCEHVREGNEKGISLCLWAGADPHAPAPNLHSFRPDDEEFIGWSAIEDAVRTGDVPLLKRFGPDPARDDFDNLYETARSGSVVKFLATIRPPQNMASILHWHLRWLGDRELRLGGGMWTIEAILACGVVWRESDPRQFTYIRRSLMKADEYDFKRFIRLCSKPDKCAPETYAELIRTPQMQKRLIALHIIKPRIPEREKRKEEQIRLARRYDREKLYEQVWSQPVQHVAKLYGISDVRLGKVCRKLLVPVPPRGYWARVRSGHKARRPVLPKLEVSKSH